MDAEDTPDVTTMGASLLTEAGGDTSVSERQVGGLNPLLHVHGRDRLLRSCDQIKGLVVIGSLNLVQVFREVGKLASLLHDRLLHEERRLDLGVLGLTQHGHTVADEGLVELHAKTLEVVAAMASDTRSTLHFEHAEAVHDFVVTKFTQSATIGNNIAFGFSPGAHDLVVVLVVRDGDIGVHDISNLAQKFFSLLDNLLGLDLLFFDLFVKCLGLSLLGRDISLLVSLLLSSDSLRDYSLLHAHRLKSVLG